MILIAVRPFHLKIQTSGIHFQLIHGLDHTHTSSNNMAVVSFRGSWENMHNSPFKQVPFL